MKMVSRIAFANMKYHKSKNILTGVAIFLTTLLLFLIPTIGANLIDGQFAMVNELYPTWHALYRNVDSETASKLAAHHDIERSGLRSDAGVMAVSDAAIALMYLDEEGFEMYKMELTEGKLPEQENEIVVSEGILQELGQTGEIGDTIKIPYQIYRDSGLDFSEEREFVISGFVTDGESSDQERTYSAFISKAFLEAEVPREQILYRFLFQVSDAESATTDEIEARIEGVAEQFGIAENNVRINTEYLGANYVDPSIVPIMACIMLIIVFAGIITIYSIYYVSMGERIQEFGKLKAIGATRRQLHRIVLGEGFAVALFAVPAGLLVGTVASRYVFMGLLDLYGGDNIMVTTMTQLLKEGRFALYYWWIYVLAIGVTLITVYLSLLRPMQIAAKVPEIEAMRYRADQEDEGKHSYEMQRIAARSVGKCSRNRRGYQDITIDRLAKIYLLGNRKKSLITICSVAMTGIFLMVVATVLACANPEESANNSVLGQYEITPIVEYSNKEHPERAWNKLQQNNPLTEELKAQLETVEGVTHVESFSEIHVTSEVFGGDKEGILGVPERFWDVLENGIVKGSVTYEELKAGDTVIIDENLLYWYPEIAIGDTLHVTVEDGEQSYEKELEVAAIGSYPIGFTNYSYLIMVKEGVDGLGSCNLNYYYHVFASENYDPEVERQLEEVIASSELLQMRSWQESYETWKSGMAMTNGGCYAFLGILSVICVMNLINTMMNSVQVRRKEIGMMQAIGMSEHQLIRLLELEGLIYTAGALLLSLGVGSALGYPVFLWAKKNGIFSISQYHYPVTAAVLISVVLLLIQLVLAFALGRSVRKESLIDRVRFSE
ncbi:MAG: ABC transporter permease [Roseburia sp.]|nr:ABC transporter permease [Roseburia sp.]